MAAIVAVLFVVAIKQFAVLSLVEQQKKRRQVEIKFCAFDKVLQAAKQTPFPTISAFDLPLFAALKFLRLPFVYCRAKVEMQNAKIPCTAAPKSFDKLQKERKGKERSEKTEMKIQIGKRICAARH